MAPQSLPTSLSPHICILPSPDLTELLQSSSLPPLENILQSFSPLPSVNTRTTTLTTVPHTAFALRFSGLAEIENACKEDEEQRAVRTIDWIGERVNRRSAKWVEDMEKLHDKEVFRTPWWDELRRCVEGDHIPSRIECWNHPAAVILAVSTKAPNPLQAITALHSRAIDLPSWIDPAYLRYTLIIHPQDSPLSEEEAGALFNAVKKQYGLHSYLLSLALPSPPPPAVPVPALMPRLPPSASEDDTKPERANKISGLVINALRLGEQDIQQTAKFTREFVVQSLVPWMEKCVNDWNEAFSSNRRLPSRLFSSTRRLFGSPSTSTASLSSNVPPPTNRSHTYSSSQSSLSNVPTQQRRLAEFATVLGDYKLATSVWESLRKEGKGGSEILPMLLSPSPALQLHAQNALASIHPPSPEPPVHVQMRGFIFAVRWETGIASAEFLSSILEGERWLVWAAGNAEEPPSALLLAHAALLSARKKARRRAALWYLFAANRLEKCGIKPLTMFFLRRAHDMYKFSPERVLSPSFWDSEMRTKSDRCGFDAIMPGIEHPLGRLLYTTGDVGGAVRFFLGLLRGSDDTPSTLSLNGNVNGDLKSLGTDKVFLEDFRVSFVHFKSTSPNDTTLSDLKLPFTFCKVSQTRIRLPRASAFGNSQYWEELEDDWSMFWKTHGMEPLEKSGKAATDETFWIDLAIHNSLDTEVNLSDLSVTVQELPLTGSPSATSAVEVETIEDIILGAKETRTIPISIKCSRAGTLAITHVTYNFLSLLPSTETLAIRGRRLHDTLQQRQMPTYGPDVVIKVEVEEAGQILQANFVDNSHLVLVQGERKPMKLWLSNEGTRRISDIWLLAGKEDQIWVDSKPPTDNFEVTSSSEILHSDNTITTRSPLRIPVKDALTPGDNIEFSIILHAEQISMDLRLLIVFREGAGHSFHSARVTRSYEVTPIFEVSTSTQPSRSRDHLFLLNLEMDNVSANPVQLTQVTTLSPLWACTPIVNDELPTLSPSQSVRWLFGASKWRDVSDVKPTLDFVKHKLADLLQGRAIDPSKPPPIDLYCRHSLKSKHVRSINEPSLHHFIFSGRRNAVSRSIAISHPHIPVQSHPSLFPLYNPFSVDVIVFWDIPSQARAGHILVPAVTFGAGHAALKEIIEDAEGAKVKRNMYAETQREKEDILDSIRASDWNAEMNPIVIDQQHGRTVKHDFSQGAFIVQTPFSLRNLSLTHASRYLLKLDPSEVQANPSNLLPPQYTGRLRFRGILKPTEEVSLVPKIWVTRPGAYAIRGWTLEVEVGEADVGDTWRTRQRYVQGPSADNQACVTVIDTN